MEVVPQDLLLPKRSSAIFRSADSTVARSFKHFVLIRLIVLMTGDGDSALMISLARTDSFEDI